MFSWMSEAVAAQFSKHNTYYLAQAAKSSQKHQQLVN